MKYIKYTLLAEFVSEFIIRSSQAWHINPYGMAH